VIAPAGIAGPHRERVLVAITGARAVAGEFADEAARGAVGILVGVVDEIAAAIT